MKKEIKCIITDYGRVINKDQNIKFVKKMAKIFKTDINEFRNIYTNQRHNYDRGTISAETYWKSIAKITETEINSQIVSELIKYDISSWAGLNRKMLDFIIKSRNKVSKLALLSNMSFDTKHYILQNYKWLDNFDVKIFSCDIKHNKPEKEIYEYCLKQIGTSAEKSLFIDDSEKNIAGAKANGINTIHFTDFHSFNKELCSNYILN